MSIAADIKTALGSLTLATYWPNYAPEGTDPPAVISSRDSYDPVMTLQGPEGTAQSIYTFACWGSKTPTITAIASARAIAAEVVAAIEASNINLRYRMPVSAEEFAEETLQVMEPVRYSFWHADP